MVNDSDDVVIGSMKKVMMVRSVEFDCYVNGSGMKGDLLVISFGNLGSDHLLFYWGLIGV